MGYLILAIPVLLIVLYISYYNGFKRRDIKTEESFSGIDVALSKRYSLITNLVECIKGYTKHEKETLSLITELRSAPSSDLESYNAALSSTKAKLLALVENYPTLKADENYLHLQKSLTDCEEHLQAARRLHNRNVADFNTFIQTLPQAWIPMIHNAPKKSYFEAKDEEKESVTISL